MTDKIWENPLHLRHLRAKARLSQNETSHMVAIYANIPVSHMAISRHEAKNENAFRFPRVTTLKAYAKLYKVPVRALYVELTDLEELNEMLDAVQIPEYNNG